VGSEYISLTDISEVDIETSVKFDVEKFLPVTAATLQILVALGDEEKHGYAIMREVAEATAGRLKLGPGTLYGAIKKLLADGLIEETEERPDPAVDDSRRRYYRLTPLGARVASAEANRLAAVLKLARKKGLFAIA
jgi:DNA-binding PadR family transcriptional regulator